MHIKQVIISGFRSFRSQSEIEPFSSKHNAIVGRNGSGKSNFFDAIQFVLVAPKFNLLRQEERQQLLHEGAGANVMTAFVEIVFDNSDGRMTVDADEVVLRRTIGLKKDEFFLNRKRVTKSEVVSLLESAGFSKSNPYYIVQQGKVNALCLMRDNERLQLLKEVAGTRVYEERREESLKIMDETNSKRDKIQEVVTYIEERLEELEGEKEELKQYQQLDRDKRALEYTIYDKELRKAREQIDELEAQRAEDAMQIHELYERTRKVQDEAATGRHELQTAEDELAKLSRNRASIERERREVIKVRAKLEVDVKEMEEQVANDEETQATLQTEAQALDVRIAETRKLLEEELLPRYGETKQAKDTLEAKHSQTELQMNELLAKQARGTRFSTMAQRDKFLREQLDSLGKAVVAKKTAIGKLETRIGEMEAQRIEIGEAIASKEQEIKDRQVSQAKLSETITSKTGERHELAEERKRRWADKQNADDLVAKWKEDLQSNERDFRSSMPRHIAQGLEAVRRIVHEEGIRGFHGALYENFQLRNNKYRTPVEVAAGNALFHVVVEDDDVAARLIKRLAAENLGRVTFMPLKQLSVQAVEYPQSSEVFSLMETALTFEPRMRKAMQQVFGKKLLARNFEVAQQFSREANMDAITLDGDEVNRKGALEGGYHDDRKSPLRAYLGVLEAREELDKARKHQEDLQAKTMEVDQAVSHLMSSIQKDEAKRANLKHVASQDAQDLKLMNEDAARLAEKIANSREKLPGLVTEQGGLEAQAESYSAEIGTPLKSTLSSSETEQLEMLRTQARELEDQLEEATATFDGAASQKQTLQALLKDNLLKRREDIEEKLSSEHGGLAGGIEVQERIEQLATRRSELAQASRDADSVLARLQELDEKVQEQTALVKATEEKLEELKAAEAADQEALAEAEKLTEKQLNKRSMLVQKREENLKKIQQLGSLPAAELDAHASFSVKELMKKLHKVNQALTKYSHVNKKALDQYVNFSEQREALIDRKRELDEGATSIQELVNALDRQKDEAILRTFKGVSKHFAEVFKELVPQGSGQLLMRTSADREEEEDGSEDAGRGRAAAQGMRVNDFEGVQVRVSFTPTGEVYLMSQLSGGQKALVALSLIFAIQRCDPAPFYLFDELDQALDSTYRAAVASMIQRLANSDSPTQFITTTFRPELVKVASKCYGISLQVKNSSIHSVSKSYALGFVADLMNEEAAVAGMAPASAAKKKPASTRAEEVAREEEEEEEEEEEQEEDENQAPKNKRQSKARSSSASGKKQKRG